MNWGSPEFVIAIIAVSMAGWAVNTWIRAKHGYPLEDEWGGKTQPPALENNRELEAKNRELIEQMEAMQDRMIVLEKIVTDRGYQLSQEIDALADKRGDELMDMDLILIFGFIIVIVSIVGGTITSVASKVIEYKKSQNADVPAADRAENARLSERTDYLEERVRVLERIATDKDGDLAREIESLRSTTPQLEKPS